MAVSQLLSQLEPGMSVYVPGASGEPLAFSRALEADPECANGVHFIGCFVPGMNNFDYAGLHPAASATTFMLIPAMADSFKAGRVNLLPQTYAMTAETLAGLGPDIAIAHVAPPGADGLCSYGISSDFTPLVWPGAKKKIAIVNPAMPSMKRGPRLDLGEADLVIEQESDLVEAPEIPATEETLKLAKRVADLVPDGASLQTGIGGAPGVIWQFLKDHKNLVLRSGMVNDWLLDLREAGALDPASGHRVGIAYGSAALYHDLAETDLVEFCTTRETHTVSGLSDAEKLHAINGALEVDLFGQVNVEYRGTRFMGGVGGGPNFTRAATLSPGGRAIIALPSTARKGTLSRIVPRLDVPSVGIARSDTDTVVTEYGVADIRNLSVDARAEALIAIAAPEFRAGLESSWATLRQSF